MLFSPKAIKNIFIIYLVKLRLFLKVSKENVSYKLSFRKITIALSTKPSLLFIIFMTVSIPRLLVRQRLIILFI